MATKDRFWDPIPAPGNRVADYALALLAELSYQTDIAAVQWWARIFDMPYFSAVLTPGVELPNFTYAGHHDRMVVAIPGTDSIPQAVQNIIYSAQRENADFGPGRMHSFFLYCAEGMLPFVRGILSSYSELREVTFVGHSLGGAVAQILADWFERNTSLQVKYCVTYNSPRVGDIPWATRARTYPTAVWYSTHDMICELPTNTTLSFSGNISPFSVSDGYVHRGEKTDNPANPSRGSLVPITSTRDIKETWWAAIAGKLGIVGGGAASRFLTGASAQAAATSVLKASKLCYLSSWFLPFPVWVDEHRMFTMVQNFEASLIGWGFPERAELKNLHDFLGSTEPRLGPLGWTEYRNADFPYAVAPPTAFQAGQNPGGGLRNALPTPTPGTRFETIEASFEWETSPSELPLPEVVMIDDSFFRALAEADAGPRGTSPLTSPTPIPVDVPARPFWYFRGHDRKLLLKLTELLELIEVRDWRCLDETQTSTLSNREQIFDFDDDELQGSVFELWNRVQYLLSLEHARR